MISVIIPVYNVAPYLRAGLDSLLSQDCRDWEALCIDDGSSDDSAKILDDYAKKDGRFIVIHQVNAGVSHARNVGLSKARGELITFLDPDDILKSDVFSQTTAMFKEHGDVDVLIFDDVQFSDGSAPQWRGKSDCKVIDVSTYIPDAVSRTRAWGALYKRSVLPVGGFKPYCLGEDILFLAECLAKAKQVIISTYCGYGYRMRGGSALRTRMTKRRLLDLCGYLCDWTDCLANSGKKIDAQTYRKIGLHLTEGYVYNLQQVDACDRDELWKHWYEVLAWMKAKKVFSQWTQFVVVICSIIKSRLLARLLCEVPHALKVRGIHR